MYSVADVLDPGFSRSWHEAVAVVREVASLLGSGSVPSPEDLWLDESGVLTLGFATESSVHPVAGLASLLTRLLDGVEAPAQLRALATQNAGSPVYTTPDAFSAQLAFFERPDRPGVLRALAQRVAGVRSPVPPAQEPETEPQPDPEAELQRLRSKVSAAADAPHPKKPVERRRITQREKRIAVAAVAAIAIVALGALVATQWSRLPSLDLGGGEANGSLAGVVSSGLSRLGLSGQSAAKGSTDAVEVEARGPGSVATNGSKPAERQQSGPRDVPRRVTRPPASQPIAVARPQASPALSAPPSALSRAATVSVPILTSIEPGAPLVRPSPERVYSSADPQVEPARLMRPQLPREPAPGDETGYFHIVVDEQGNVEQVRLYSPRHRYHDRMLVAAAKAWKFRPARLGGESVRYELQIPIILKGMP